MFLILRGLFWVRDRPERRRLEGGDKTVDVVELGLELGIGLQLGLGLGVGLGGELEEGESTLTTS